MNTAGVLVPELHTCDVDAGGVAAEWVETVVATAGQPTIVYLRPYGGRAASGELDRRTAGELAFVTGARIFSVGDRSAPGQERSPVETTIDAYRWLLGEGVDVDRTAFVGAPGLDSTRLVAVLRSLTRRSLPPPAAAACFGAPQLAVPGDRRTGPPILMADVNRPLEQVANWLALRWTRRSGPPRCRADAR